MLSLEQKFSRLTDEKHQMEKDYSERVDCNIKLIQIMRSEIETEVSVYEERRHLNCDLNIQIDK